MKMPTTTTVSYDNEALYDEMSKSNEIFFIEDMNEKMCHAFQMWCRNNKNAGVVRSPLLTGGYQLKLSTIKERKDYVTKAKKALESAGVVQLNLIKEESVDA